MNSFPVAQLDKFGRPFEHLSTDKLKSLRLELEREIHLRGKETMRSISEMVAAKHGMSYLQMVSGGRQRNFVYARQEAAFELHLKKRWSLAQIAKTLEMSDHTTVLYSIRAHISRIAKCAGGEKI